MRTKQCAKCPWRVDVDPHDIPDGYSEELHAALESTIAQPGVINLGDLPMMACHESKPEKEQPCVGWLANQLGEGNNIGLRLWYAHQTRTGKIKEHLQLVGEQHQTFEETLP